MKHLIALCLLFALSVIPPEALAQPTTGSITFASNPTWASYRMNPDGSLGELLGPAQCEDWYAYGTDLSAIPGACWLWRAGDTADSLSDLQGTYIIKELDVPGMPLGGEMLLSVDDYAEIRVNGGVIGTRGSVTNIGAAAAAQGRLLSFDLTPHLVMGINTITVVAQNGPASFAGGRCGPCTYSGNQAGVVFGGTITFDGATPVATSSWGNLKIRYR